MSGRQVFLYFAWNRPRETTAALEIIDDRFPALFEMRRLFYPRFEHIADASRFDQGIGGFLDHIQKPNFAAFAEQSAAQTGSAVLQVERVLDDGTVNGLDEILGGDADTVIIVSFDSFSTGQFATASEIGAARRFLSDPDKLLCICPHHDIGNVPDLSGDALIERQTGDHLHHGDRGIPPRQGFGGFARTLLAGLGVPVENRYGLRPAVRPDGTPCPIEIEAAYDRLGLLDGIASLNAHAHLPHFERLGGSVAKLDVLARQAIDMTAPAHPFTRGGRSTFDALLQSAPEAFAGTLLVCDATLFSSNAGGLDELRRFWSNIILRPVAS